jgi:hypothetical protein
VTLDGSSGRAAVDIALSTDGSNNRNYACAIMDDSTLRCWGGYNSGKIGNGLSTAGSQTTPTQVRVDNTQTYLRNVTSIDAAEDHTCAVADQDGDGTKEGYCWGYPTHYRLGNGDAVTEHDFADDGPP